MSSSMHELTGGTVNLPILKQYVLTLKQWRTDPSSLMPPATDDFFFAAAASATSICSGVVARLSAAELEVGVPVPEGGWEMGGIKFKDCVPGKAERRCLEVFFG